MWGSRRERALADAGRATRSLLRRKARKCGDRARPGLLTAAAPTRTAKYCKVLNCTVGMLAGTQVLEEVSCELTCTCCL